MAKNDEEVLNLDINDGNPENYHSEKINLSNKTQEVIYIPNRNDSKNSFTKLEAIENYEIVQRSDPFFLYATAFTADLLSFVVGIGFSWTSPVLPKLEGPDSPFGFPINAFQKSWIATFLSIGAVVGPLIAGRIADSLGRKKTMILLAFPMLSGLLILAYAKNIYLYYLARFLHGVSVGSCMAVVPMYKSEVTEKHNRGKFGCIMGFFITLGLLYPFLVGSVLDIKMFSLTCAVPLLIFLVVFTTFMPETPQYLLLKNNKDGAIEALMSLRNRSYEEVQPELKELTRAIDEENEEKSGIKELVSVPGLRKAFIISIALTGLMQLSGINAVTGYLHTIFQATNSSIPPDIAALCIGIMQVLANFIPALIVERLGRKILLLSSVIGSAASIFLLGTYFFLQTHRFNVAFIWWLPIGSLVIYTVAFNTGLGILPWTVMSEIFPSNVKSTAASLTTSMCYFISAVVTLGFPILSELLSMAECFWLFGILLTLGAVFIQIVVPETKGKTVHEIQDILSGNNKA